MIKVIPCETEAQFEQYVRFIFAHRKELYPNADFKACLKMICNHFNVGHIVIGLDEDGGIMGAFVYSFGTPYENYRNTDVVMVKIALLREDHRRTDSYVIGMTSVMECILKSGRDAREIQFLAYRKFPDLHRIYRKFAEEYEPISDDLFLGYRVSLADYRQFCTRFGKKGLFEEEVNRNVGK